MDSITLLNSHCSTLGGGAGGLEDNMNWNSKKNVSPNINAKN
jgi:hypothetical protein